MEKIDLSTARMQVVRAIGQGIPWHKAAKRARLRISQSTAYRLRQMGLSLTGWRGLLFW